MKNIVLVTMFLCNFLASCQFQNKESKEWVETIGFIKGSPSNYYIYNKVNEIEYRKRYGYLVGMLYEDEKCKIRYDLNDPNQIEILYWHPCFLPNEPTFVTNAEIKLIQKANILSKLNNINFQYTFGDIQFERNQILPPNYKELYPDLKEGQTYEVECWVENPQRAIIHLDKPI